MARRIEGAGQKACDGGVVAVAFAVHKDARYYWRDWVTYWRV